MCVSINVYNTTPNQSLAPLQVRITGRFERIISALRAAKKPLSSSKSISTSSKTSATFFDASCVCGGEQDVAVTVIAEISMPSSTKKRRTEWECVASEKRDEISLPVLLHDEFISNMPHPISVKTNEYK